MASETRELKFYIDQPIDWTSLKQHVAVRGWCFGPAGQSIRMVRLRGANLVLNGVLNQPRPDVKAALPEAPDDNTGFEIRGTLPAGQTTVFIEAQLANGTWLELVRRQVRVRRQHIPLWLGGGQWTELMLFQMPGHMAYPPKVLKGEKFPSLHTRPHSLKFSIITPSYQQARFLAETMRSVLEQSGVDCEYVVQDGGSTDGSKELIERVAAETGVRRLESGSERNSTSASSLQIPACPKSPRIISWTSCRDNGQADAIVKGFAKTSGRPDDVMAWINSDDFYLPGTFAYVADYFARHPEVDVIYGHRIVVDEESREIARWFLPPHSAEVLRLNDYVPQETLFWRRRIWDRVEGLDNAFKFAMDWDLLLRFEASGAKIVRVPYFLACFRVHAAQKTSAQMHSVGQQEITMLRERTYGRPFPPQDLECNPILLRYLRRSALIEFLWKLGIRMP